MPRKKEIDRDRILDAAESVIMEAGVRAFTVERVAEHAGVSKGGVTYTFATKNDLIAAVIERELRQLNTIAKQKADSIQGDAEGMILNYVAEAVQEDDAMIRRAAILLTAVVHAPSSMDSAIELYRSLFALFDDTTERGRDVRQAFLATEALFLLGGLGIVDVTPKDWQSVGQHALKTILQLRGEKTDDASDT